MNHQLLQLFSERLASGLKRKSLTEPSRWACNYRVMGQPYPGKWTFKYHPWLKDMHDSKAELNIGQKSAQMGFTEAVLNITWFKMDVEGVSCLYILPAKTPDASDFSSSRFDPALELSEHLAKMFSDVKNIGHKRAGVANLYIRGSKSRAGLKSVPVGFIVLDEVDEMTQDNIPLALERSSGQVEKQAWMISTPTIPQYGINAYFENSTKERFHFECPSCSQWIELTFPESVIITGKELNDPEIKNTQLICTKCKANLPHEDKPKFLSKGRWISDYHNRDSRGFHINQLYSPTVRPDQIANNYFLSLRDQAAEQEFFNSKLGTTHIVDGARLNDDNINHCIAEFKKSKANQGGLITLGCDVGRWLHIEIDSWHLPKNYGSADINALAVPRVIWQGKVPSFDDLDKLMYQFDVNAAVIDAQPERRKSFEFANKYFGRVKMCFYGRAVQGRNANPTKDIECAITVDRTSWLDLSLGRFKRGKKGILLPCDLDFEYREHIKAPVRIYEKDDDGNPVGRYVNGSEADHYAHARNYAEIALQIAMAHGTNHTMENPL